MSFSIENNICYNFKNSMYIDIDGEVYPCTYGAPYINQGSSEGNIYKQKLEVIFNKRTGDIKLKPYCHSCTTCRLYTNKDSVYDVMFLKIDNLCNFSCLSCGKRDSTGFKKYDKSTKLNSIFDAIKDNIDFIDKFKRIIIVGGEPLISKNVLSFLKLLSKEKEIVIFSNLSIMSNEHIDELKKFSLVTFYCSIDDLNSINIREGFKKSIFFKNFKFLKKQRFNMYFNVTVSILNIFNLEKIFNTLKKMIDPNRVHFMKLLFPNEYNINILPVNVKKIIEKNLLSIAKECDKDFTGDRTNCYNSCNEIIKILYRDINYTIEDAVKKLEQEDIMRKTNYKSKFIDDYKKFIKK